MAPDELEQIKQRRRAIKLTAGVSTIFTLASGSALAATSSPACLRTDEKVAENVVVRDPPAGESWNFDIGEPTGDGYVYQGNNTFVTASCWSSVNPQAAAGASSRIV